MVQARVRSKKSSGKKLQMIQKSAATERLDHFLRRELPRTLGHEISNSEIRRLILGGKTKVRLIKALTPDHLVRKNDKVEVMITDHLTDTVRRSEQHKKIKVRILFEDPWLIAVEKPAGIPTHPTIDRDRANVFDLLVAQIQARDNSSEPYLAIHHRLDRDTSGIVLFVKDPAANEAIGDLFKTRQISKTYIAVSACPANQPKDSWKIENFLGPTKKLHGKQIYGPVHAGGQHAVTNFRRLEVSNGRVRIEASPITGRTHQIRSHLLSSGFPIVGDELYFDQASKSLAANRLYLHACRLSFIHPLTQVAVQIECPPPF